MMVVISVLYSGVGETQRGVQDREGVLFFVAIFFAFNGIFQVTPAPPPSPQPPQPSSLAQPPPPPPWSVIR